MIPLRSSTVALACLLGAAACSPGNSAPAGQEHPPENQLWISPGDLDGGSMRVGNAQTRDLPKSILTSGRLAFNDLEVAHIFSPVSGRVSGILAQPGQHLVKGDPLATLVSPDVGNAVSDEVKARADLQAAQRDRDRQVALADAGAASERDQEGAEDTYQKAKAEEERALQRLRILKGGRINAVTQEYTLPSPIAGRLIARMVNPGVEVQGQYAGGTAVELFTVGSIDTLWLYADLAEPDLPKVHVGTEIAARVLAYPSRVFRGTVEWISPTLDPQLRTARIRCSLPNAEGLLKPEMFASVSLELPQDRHLAIPRGALKRIADHDFVYVPTGARPDGHQIFERRMVEVPQRNGPVGAPSGSLESEVVLRVAAEETWVPVLSGLSEGDRVLVDGAGGDDLTRSEVTLTATQGQSGRVQVEPVQEAQADNLVSVGGRLTYDDLQVAHVFPPVGGRITQVIGQMGQHVQKGDPLAIIVSPDLGSAFSDVLKAKADWDASQHELKRQEELFAHHAGAERDLEAAQDNELRCKAEYDRALERTQLLRQGALSSVTQEFVLRSPIDGEISARAASPGLEVQGQYSGGGNVVELFTIGRMNPIWLLGDAFEMDLPYIKVGDEVSLRVSAWPNEEFRGKVDWISDVLDPVMRTARVRCVLENPEHRLRPEMYGAVSLHVPERRAVSVPREAVLRLGDSTVVFVEAGANAAGDRTFHLRRVLTDEQATGDRVPILSGLAPGERVATRGAIFLVGLL